MTKGPEASCEDVLEAFALEENPNADTLSSYLRQYPQFARELVDLSRELDRTNPVNEAPMSPREMALLDAAWLSLAEGEAAAIDDPFAALSALELGGLSRRLGVPRQVITAFLERRVVVGTIPAGFLQSLADALRTTREHLAAILAIPVPALARSHKADRKPVSPPAVSFEQILVEAGVPSERRAELLSHVD